MPRQGKRARRVPTPARREHRRIEQRLNKDFAITDRIRYQLHMDAFNAINNMNYNNPNMSVTSSQFGKSTDIYSQDYGRRLQLGMRVTF